MALIKVYPYFIVYFIVGMRANLHLHHILGLRTPWCQHWQGINSPGRCEGQKWAATLQSLGWWGWGLRGWQGENTEWKSKYRWSKPLPEAGRAELLLSVNNCSFSFINRCTLLCSNCFSRSWLVRSCCSNFTFSCSSTSASFDDFASARVLAVTYQECISKQIYNGGNSHTFVIDTQ